MNTGLKGDEFFELMLEQAGVACVPGSAFGNGGVEHVRLSLNANIPMIKKSLAKMSDALNIYSMGE
jgi:aminotransferase